MKTLLAYQAELERPTPERESRVIPLYRTPAAAGYAAPVFGEDFDYLAISDEIPQAAEFAVRIQGDSMVPYIADGDVVYVNRTLWLPGTWASSAWTARCSASSITRTPPGRCICSP